MLVFGDARLDRIQFGQPVGAAELAAAPADAIYPFCLIAHADVPHVYACAKEPFELPHELPEVHSAVQR